jgi:hypothetical protein
MTRAMTDSELMDYIEPLSFGLAEAVDRIEALEKRVKSLENDTPQARQLQLEADMAVADCRAAGIDLDDPAPVSQECRDRWHGQCPATFPCNCPCHFEDEECE